MFSVLRKRVNKFRGASDEDSDDEDIELRNKVAKKLHSRRPPNTAFRQQRLKSWQPVLTARVVIPLLLLAAVVFIPIGIGIFLTTYNVEVLQINYSECDSKASAELSEMNKKDYSHHFKTSKMNSPQWSYNSDKKLCTIQFEIPNDVKGDVFMYYKLTNFYQNHRKYVESYDWNQLRGDAVAWDDISSKCDPMRYRDDKIIYPAGLVANSLFNDTFSNLTSVDNSEDSYEFSSYGIAWKSDLTTYKVSKYNISDIVPPINWMERFPNGYTEQDLVDLASNEHFMNWMKTAALPSFMKLYGKHTEKNSLLKKGTYNIDIEMNYPVTIFGGTKSLILTTSSVVGGRHMGLGVCYLVAGGLAILFMLLFLVKQLVTRNKNEHSFLENLNEGHPLSSSGMRQVL